MRADDVCSTPWVKLRQVEICLFQWAAGRDPCLLKDGLTSNYKKYPFALAFFVTPDWKRLFGRIFEFKQGGDEEMKRYQLFFYIIAFEFDNLIMLDFGVCIYIYTCIFPPPCHFPRADPGQTYTGMYPQACIIISFKEVWGRSTGHFLCSFWGSFTK